jgi:hypothetical protein
MRCLNLSLLWCHTSIAVLFIGQTGYLEQYVGFEVLTAVVMKSSVFWDLMPCSPLKVNQSFSGTCRHHLQGWRISQVRNQHEAGSKQSSACLAYSLTLKMEVTCSSETLVDFQWTTMTLYPRRQNSLLKQVWMCMFRDLLCSRGESSSVNHLTVLQLFIILHAKQVSIQEVNTINSLHLIFWKDTA